MILKTHSPGQLLAIVFFSVCNISENHAASITLVPANPTITVGNQATFQLLMDFTGEPTIGGGIDIAFDNFVNGNQMTFVSYVPEALGDPDLINVPALNAAGTGLDTITFGDVVNGLEGPALVGTLTFLVNAVGTYSLSLSDSVAAGAFQSLLGQPLQITYAGASITGEAPVPVPLPTAALLFLGGGIQALFGRVFRKI